MNRATSATGWVRNPALKLPDLDPTQASSYDLGWTLNPITGCLNHIDGLCKGGGFPCYAYKLAHGRLRNVYLANHNIAPTPHGIEHLPFGTFSTPFYPRFWEDRLPEPSPHKMLWKGVPIGVFVCDMSDLFGIGIPEEWTRRVLEVIKSQPWHRFYLLTKQPQNLIKFSPFPDNCWVGVTATNKPAYNRAIEEITKIEASVKYISFEPLLGDVSWCEPEGLSEDFIDAGINWVIIGALTCKAGDILHRGDKYPELKAMPYGKIWTLQPKIEWVEEIVRACDKAGVPVFLKDNLAPIMAKLKLLKVIDGQGLPRMRGDYTLRQEMPRCHSRTG